MTGAANYCSTAASDHNYDTRKRPLGDANRVGVRTANQSDRGQTVRRDELILILGTSSEVATRKPLRLAAGGLAEFAN